MGSKETMITAQCARCHHPLPAGAEAFVLAIHQQPVTISPVIGVQMRGQAAGQPIALVCPACVALLAEGLAQFVVRTDGIDGEVYCLTCGEAAASGSNYCAACFKEMNPHQPQGATV